MKKIISVINQKGGVGKTTTSINFACGLALEGYQVLLIDLDPQAHSTIGIGIDPGDYEYAVHDVLLKRKPIHEVILKAPVENVDLVPSHIRLDKAEQQLTPEMFRESKLHGAIQELDYDFIVIDCRPTLGTLTINALYACDFIIVPSEMSRYALDGFSDLLDTIDTVKATTKLNKKDFIRLLLTKYDSRKTITNDWIMAQLDPFKELLFNTKIRQNEALNQSQIAQESIFVFKPQSSGAEDYTQLTEEFLEICQAEKN
ncbi:MAG: ParA family protein [Bacteroidota bacterium]